jgi:hypothetical protein
VCVCVCVLRVRVHVCRVCVCACLINVRVCKSINGPHTHELLPMYDKAGHSIPN